MFGSSRSNSGDGEGTLAKVLRALRLAWAAARPRSSASAAMSRKPRTPGAWGIGGGGEVFSKLRRVGRSPRGGNWGAAIGTCGGGARGGCGRGATGGGRGRSPCAGGGDGGRGRAEAGAACAGSLGR